MLNDLWPRQSPTQEQPNVVTRSRDQQAALSITASAGHSLPALAAMLGVIVLAVVGFAPIEVVHNAAHDTRHAAGFCHRPRLTVRG